MAKKRSRSWRRDEARPARIREKLLASLRGRPEGLTRTEIYTVVFTRSYTAAQIDAVVNALVAEGVLVADVVVRPVVEHRKVKVFRLTAAATGA